MMMTEILTPLEEELLQALQALMEETITANTSDKVGRRPSGPSAGPWPEVKSHPRLLGILMICFGIAGRIDCESALAMSAYRHLPHTWTAAR